MEKICMKEIRSEQELKDVLELCLDILGRDVPEIYGYDAWHERLLGGREPLVYAQAGDGRVVSAVLGREENKDSLVIGFVACHKDYRRQGLALACSAAFLLECLGKNLIPNWSAVNLQSVGLAEKLGYVYDREYQVYQIKGEL